MPDDIESLIDDWELGPPSLFVQVVAARDMLDKVLSAIARGDDPARVAAMLHQVAKLLQELAG